MLTSSTNPQDPIHQLRHQRAYCTILNSGEEKSIVYFVKNKNKCMQAVNEGSGETDTRYSSYLW